ncbi:8380_t:CDS:2 [Cetraspora pellucida]|uniref:8380_t:CDS:1 n=1 Tax=Cetraspora pellucida TaxID=1433469 RepID=A0A9N9NKA6_9GLOM|nr:8380_t:CDS:2 [Cetraspora pellucida]
METHIFHSIQYYTNKLGSDYKIVSRLWSLLMTIRHEILIMYSVSVADWTTAIIPPLLMAIASVEEDRLNKPFRPIASGLITVEGAKCHLIAFCIIYPIIAYLVGGLSSLILCFMWQVWIVFNETLKLGKNAFYKNLFSAVGMWIQLASCYYIILDTDPSLYELLSNKPCLYKFAIFFFIMTTAQVQDMGDQKGDKLIGRKTLPLLISDNICRWLTVLMLIISLLVVRYISSIFLHDVVKGIIINGLVPYEFVFVEFILITLNLFTCIRLIIYRMPKQDSFTYQICYGGFYCTLCLYYGMCINKHIELKDIVSVY